MTDYNYGGAPWIEHAELLKSLVLEEGITSIGDNAFYNCSGFTGSLTIPNLVTEVGRSAFYGCIALTYINVDNNNLNYTSQDEVLFN